MATGIDTDYEILSPDEWVASRLRATNYRDRRVFLAGDACHLHPSFGGYGMNMGVADAVDLGWKLSAVLRGWGGSCLLDSYQAERMPLHADQAGPARGLARRHSRRQRRRHYRARQRDRTVACLDSVRRSIRRASPGATGSVSRTTDLT